MAPAATVVSRDGLLAFSGGSPTSAQGAVYTVRPDGSKLRRLPLPVALGPEAVAWSPDGTRLAFAADDLPAHEDSNLYVVGADGRGLRQLTHGLLGVSALAWSPDGRSIAFVVGRAPPRQMYTVSARGGRPHRLDIAGRPANVLGIAWQPVASVRASTRQSSAMRG